jgi:hypothetical protein
MERIAMSTTEQRRAAVLQQVVDGEVTLRAATRHLGTGYRHAKRLLARFRRAGARGIRHGNLGRRSNRAWPTADQAAILALVRTQYGGTADGRGQRFGPTLAAEHLFSDHGHLVPVPTLRRWMLAAELWAPTRRPRPAHRRRPRRDGFGELVQLDGSFHDWFEGRGVEVGAAPCLMSLVDDATGTMLARFTPQETTWAAADVLRRWIETYGVPRALYVDAKNVYVRPPTTAERITGRPALTQFGKMCARLGIEVITAHSPQAKGRIERNHGTSQDRLVKKLRLAGIAAIDRANQFLATSYLADHNQRFSQPAAAVLDAHTPLARHLRLDAVFTLETERTLGNDWVVQYAGRALQVCPSRAAQRHVAPGRRVLVRESEAGRLRLVVVHPETSREVELAWEPATRLVRAPTARGATSGAPAGAPPSPDRPPPAGYTRSGKPLSAKQMAVRAHWSNQVSPSKARQAPPLDTGVQPPPAP